MLRDEDLILDLKARRSISLDHPTAALTKPEEWRELILDITHSSDWNATPQENSGLPMYYMKGFLGDARSGSDPLMEAPGFFKSLPMDQRPIIRKAFHLIVDEIVRNPIQENKKILQKILFLAQAVIGVIPGSDLCRIIGQKQLYHFDRMIAGVVLVKSPYADSVPVSFWEEIDLNADPVMVIPVVTALVEERKTIEALDRLNTAPHDPKVHELNLKYLFQRIVKNLLMSTNGYELASVRLKKLPAWAIPMMHEVIALEAQSAPASHKATVMLNALAR